MPGGFGIGSDTQLGDMGVQLDNYNTAEVSSFPCQHRKKIKVQLSENCLEEGALQLSALPKFSFFFPLLLPYHSFALTLSVFRQQNRN